MARNIEETKMITTLTILSARQGISYKAPALDQFDDNLLEDIGLSRTGAPVFTSTYVTGKARPQRIVTTGFLAGFAAAMTRLIARGPASRQIV
jgi:hypothetical protein